MPVAMINEIEVYWELSGQAGDPLVLVHGSWADHHSWDRIVQERVHVVIELLERGEMESGARQFVETVAFGPGAWEQLPDELRQTLIFNAPTFLDEQRDPEWLRI